MGRKGNYAEGLREVWVLSLGVSSIDPQLSHKDRWSLLIRWRLTHDYSCHASRSNPHSRIDLVIIAMDNRLAMNNDLNNCSIGENSATTSRSSRLPATRCRILLIKSGKEYSAFRHIAIRCQCSRTDSISRFPSHAEVPDWRQGRRRLSYWRARCSTLENSRG